MTVQDGKVTRIDMVADAGNLQADPPALASVVSAGRVGAAALSLALTAGLMVWWKVPHPPVLLTVQGFVINRLAGVDYPRWRSGG